MNLKVYLAENDVTAKDFAEIIGYQATYISTIIKGKKLPGRKLAAEIEKWTGGRVNFQKELSQKCKKKNQENKEGKI